MQVTTMQMDPRVAAIHYKDYRKKVREHRAQRLAKANLDVKEGGKRFRAGRIAKSELEKEDETLMESYRVMAQGQRVVNVLSVLREAGLTNDTRLPKLALAGAHWKECYLTWSAHRNRFEFSKDRWGAARKGWSTGNEHYTDGCQGFPLHVFTATVQNQEWRAEQKLPVLPVAAEVPSIPAALRPAGDLSKYCILWEAVWKKTEAPLDPLLLQHVHGYIYTVVAQWDLTDLERAVLEGRIT
jgi:hypothetical protein